MKEPLLSLNPAPETELGSEPDVPQDTTHEASSSGLRMISPHGADPLSEPEPLIDPLSLSAPARVRRQRTIQIPLSWVVLGMAGTALLMIGVMVGLKISDYHHGHYFEKRFAKLFDVPDLPADFASSTDPAPVRPTLRPSAPAPTGVSEPAIAQSPSPEAFPAGATASLPQAGTSSAPANGDFEGELAALRQERQLRSQLLEQLNTGAPAPSTPRSKLAPPPVPESSASAASPLPSNSPPFGNPAASGPAGAQLSPDEVRIRDAPAIARVREYDPDWHFVVLDGGKERNITPGTQLAVRRGHQILGLIRVDEVEDKESVAELLGTWKADVQAPKPHRGDDVVTYPPF